MIAALVMAGIVALALGGSWAGVWVVDRITALPRAVRMPPTRLDAAPGWEPYPPGRHRAR